MKRLLFASTFLIGTMASNASLGQAVTTERTMTRNVTLPPGVLVEGILKTADGAPVGHCEVRAFEPGSDLRPAALRGRARSASDGRFRMIVPR